MVWQATPYTIPLLAAGVISLVAALFTWRRSHFLGAGWAALLLLGCAIWTSAYALEMASIVLPDKLFWNKCEYLGIASIPTIFLIFALKYTGREGVVTGRRIALMAVEPVLIFALVWTNETHHLIWINNVLDTSGPFTMLLNSYGAAFWANALYAYAFLLAASLMLAEMLLRSRHLYRWQVSVLLISVLVPWLGNAIFILGLNPFRGLDLTPIAFSVTSLGIALGISVMRRGDIASVSRSTIVEHIADGLLVLDAEDRVVDMNAAAEALFRRRRSQCIGKHVGEVWPEWFSAVFRAADGIAEVQLRAGQDDEVPGTYELRLSHVNDWRGRLVSRVAIIRDISERKMIEAALLSSEARHRELADSLPQTVVEVDVAGRLTFVNQSGLQTFGYSAHDFEQGVYVLEVLAPEDRARGRENLTQVLSGHQHNGHEYTVQRKDGSKFPVIVYTSPMLRQGKIVGLRGVVVDISLRKRTEEALQESERRFRNFVEHSQDGVVLVDEGGTVVEWNHAQEQITGLPKSAVLGRPIWDVQQELAVAEERTPAHYSRRQNVTQRILEGETLPEQFAVSETTIARTDGSRRVVHMSSLQIKSNGAITLGTITRDVTEHKQMEQALRDSEERYRDLFDNAPIGIYRTASDGRLLMANPAIVRMLGYSSFEELAAHNPHERKRPVKHQDTSLAASDQADEGVTEVESVWTNCDGSKVFVREFVKARRDNDGTILYYDGTVEDITARTQAEDELRRSQLMLQQSEKMASLGQLAAGVAHEINNPMGFIGSNMNTLVQYLADLKSYIERCEELLCGPEGDGGGEYQHRSQALGQLREQLEIGYILSDAENLIRESLEGSERVKRIVRDLKSFARTDGEGIEQANVNTILDSALNIVWNQLKYTCGIVKDYGQLPEIPCNASQLGQVFVNLLVNAGQAIDKEQRGEIRISTRAEGSCVYVEVGDNGHGIAPENLGKIFEPFYTTKPVGQGTGLGLAISYGIVKKHGGEIRVRSEISVGTTFVVELPVNAAGTTAAAISSRAA